MQTTTPHPIYFFLQLKSSEVIEASDFMPLTNGKKAMNTAPAIKASTIYKTTLLVIENLLILISKVCIIYIYIYQTSYPHKKLPISGEFFILCLY